MSVLLDFISRLLGRFEDDSKTVAKERLRLVLVQDRSNMSPEVLDELKEELISLISRYMDIDQDTMSVELDRSDNSVALVASIPVKNMKARTPVKKMVENSNVGS